MEVKYSNASSVPLSIAVFLATDHYDYDDDPNTISATTLIRPLRQIILSSRVPDGIGTIDLLSMMQARMGTAIHNGIEIAWKQHYAKALSSLGYPQSMIERVRINPQPSEVTEGIIPVYLEQRAKRQVGKYFVSGKFDIIIDGRLEDVKSTSAFVVVSGSNDEKFSLQGSIYRWLNPSLITKDSMAIQYIITDWNKHRAQADPKYPQQRHYEKVLPLKSVLETDAWIRRKVQQIDAYWDAPEDELPLCSDSDLWRTEPTFKYYKNPTNATAGKRSTKNFETLHDARLRLIEDGNVGVIKEIPGQVTACKYCKAFPICSQKDALIANGDLVMGTP